MNPLPTAPSAEMRPHTPSARASSAAGCAPSASPSPFAMRQTRTPGAPAATAPARAEKSVLTSSSTSSAPPEVRLRKGKPDGSFGIPWSERGTPGAVKGLGVLGLQLQELGVRRGEVPVPGLVGDEVE